MPRNPEKNLDASPEDVILDLVFGPEPEGVEFTFDDLERNAPPKPALGLPKKI